MFRHKGGDEVPAVYRWSIAACECYLRGCVCNGCYYKQVVTHRRCVMKKSVLKLVRKFGIPPEEIIKLAKGE